MAVVAGKLIVYGSYSSAMSPSVCVESVEMMGEHYCQTSCVTPYLDPHMQPATSARKENRLTIIGALIILTVQDLNITYYHGIVVCNYCNIMSVRRPQFDIWQRSRGLSFMVSTLASLWSTRLPSTSLLAGQRDSQ